MASAVLAPGTFSTAMESEIDHDLYSRQIYAIGADTMKKMSSARMLLWGLTGTGCEIAKDLILSGIGQLTLYDPEPVSWNDLSSLFYTKAEDVGKSRVDAVYARLCELNHYVSVHKNVAALTPEVLKGFDVVIIVDQPVTQMSSVTQACHDYGVKLVTVESRGVSGMIFCDFGSNFHISDVDGEELPTCLITALQIGNPTVIHCHEDVRHNLEDGMRVHISDIQGPDTLNDKEYVVTVLNPLSFSINVDSTAMPNYVRGGYVRPLRKTATMQFLAMDEALKQPEFIITDFAKMEHPTQLHVFFQGLHKFIADKKRAPQPWNEAEALEVLQLAKAAAPADFKVDENLIKKLASTSAGNLGPMAAFLGGFAAQEALKACTGKFTPIHQWFYFDAIEILPTTLPTAADCAPQNCRYDGQIAIFGKAFNDVILNQRIFIVGAGALGCEFLKNFAMMGVGCGEQGKIVVTDMDTIEKSNLSRQFLFRQHHIGRLKSEVAASAAHEMNSEMKVRFMADKCGTETEHTFDDVFWDELTGVTNALDNVQARLYVDQKCVYYRKPLLESGTLGTKGNVQIVCPFKTESYGSSRDPPEKSIPICTLKNFPNAIEHTIQWARDSFEGLFSSNPGDANAYITRADFLPSLDKEPGTKLTTLQSVHEYLVSQRPSSFQDCVGWARMKFEEFFNNQIQQLLYNFPEDAVTNSGEKFWSGPKRPPRALTFDPEDEMCIDFVLAGALLRAVNYGIQPEGDRQWVARAAGAVHVPTFAPKKANIQTEENQKVEEDKDAGVTPEELVSRLPPAASLARQLLAPIEFEKDDDSNHHIEFITACSNLRARNYKIPEADRHRTKQIAGKIIPAMVTTTALVTGLVCMEWYKLFDDALSESKRNVDTYKNAFVNLALPFITLSEPVAPLSATFGDKKFTLWDRFDVSEGRDISLQEFLDYFQQKHNLEINMLSCGQGIVYSFFTSKQTLAKRLPRPVSDVVSEILKTEFPPNQRFLTLEMCATMNDEDVEVPYIRYRFRF